MGPSPHRPQALFAESQANATTVCRLCCQHCQIKPGQRGTCGVRENRAGQLIPLAYGRLEAIRADPVEKKPLFHYQPGSRSLSIASMGCNLQCPWCQNHELAQGLRLGATIAGPSVPASTVVDQAVAQDCSSISFTYSEPTIHMEYNYAVGVLARERGLGNIFVTNGTMTADVARFAAESFLDAANVDLKAMKGSTYRKHCKAGAQGLETVLDCISALHKAGVWVEVTTLIIPGLNDDDDELRDAARFLVGVSPDIPWHLSRYHPDFRWLSSPPTPVATLRRAHALGREEGLNYVYTGNIWGDDREHTTCPNCQGVLLRRRGFTVDVTGFRGDGSGTCAHCGFHVAGVQLP